MGTLATIRDFLLLKGNQTPLPPPQSSWDRLAVKADQTSDSLSLLSGSSRTSFAGFSDGELETIQRDSFRKLSVVFACMTILADAVAESPLTVNESIDGQKEQRPDHPLRQLLAEPNPEQSEAEFLGAIVLVAGLNGFALVETVRSKSGEIIQLYPRSPEDFKAKQRDGETVWEHRTRGTVDRIVKAEDMIVIPYQTDPRLKRRGISPLEVISREAGIDSALIDFLKHFLDEGAVPPFAIVTKDTIYDQTRIDALQERWHQKHGGGKAWDRVPVLHGGFDIVPIGGDLDTMAWPDLRGLTELRICQAWNVPPHLVFARDAIMNGGLSTTEQEQAMKMLQQYGARALRNRIDGAMTRGLLRQFEPDRRWSLEFDTSKVLALQEDENQRHERVRADYIAGMLKLGESRHMLGLDDLGTDGDVFAVPFSTTFVAANDLLGEATPELPAPTNGTPKSITAGWTTTGNVGTTITVIGQMKRERHYRDHKALSRDELETRSKALDGNRKAQRKLTSLGDRVMRKFFKAQGERIIGTLNLRSDEGLNTKVAESVNWDDEEEELAKVLRKFYDVAGKTAFQVVSDQTGISVDWNLANPNVNRVYGDLVGRPNGIQGISATTQEQVTTVIQDSLAEGVTGEALAERLSGLFEETYRGRALNVARTESMVAVNTASVLGFHETGQVDEVEYADSDTHCDDYGASDGLSCCDRNGLVTPIDEAQDHIDAEHPNGSLAVLPIVKPLAEVGA